ncbi:DUF4192 domain-containing protein [Actinoplanes subtropicus]|uniref:DUF4192 domain-containing protein n=1 Tax=Actinoplanes subtropicus TaxID=543632 RepID=UPI0004C2EE65|nr:DUF4192 domain-containing protein [Actinoplanes subtropicus]
MSHRPAQRLSDPAPVLAAVPHLIEFRPVNRVVAIGLRHETIVAVGHLGLSEETDNSTATAAMHRLASHLSRADTGWALLLGYGPATPVAATVATGRDCLQQAGIVVDDPLRVAGGRWWNLACTEPSCCPPEGTAFEPTPTAVLDTAAPSGRYAVHLAGVDGPARAAFAAAESIARQRLTFMARQLPAIEDATLSAIAAGRTLPQTAVQEIDETLADQLRHQQVSAAQAALVAILLRSPTVLDAAMRRATGQDAQIRLWTLLVRHAHHSLVAGPATLLAVNALLAGDQVLARAAVSRALAADPDHQGALMAQRLLAAGTGPAAVVRALDT